MYCVVHAENEQLVPAVGLSAGLSACGRHLNSPKDGPSSAALQLSTAPSCTDCDVTQHRAYFVVDQRPLCIRHAADAVFPEDDGRAHNMAHAAYIRLNELGVADAY